MKFKQLFTIALFLLVAETSAFAQGPCPTFSFSFTTSDCTCSGNSDGSTTVTVTGGADPYTYLWSINSGSQTTQMATGLAADNYSVTVTDDNGCVESEGVTIGVMTTETPAICMVTTDANSINNIIYWDKTPYVNVDSFIIHREVSTLVYNRIGAVHRDSLSEFIDTTRSVGQANGDPNLAAYRYKIQIRDNCGNYGALSPYHNTIHITEDGLGTFSWAILYEIEGQSNPVTNYILLCDTINTNVWVPVNTVGPTTQSAIDPGFSAHPTNANWRVKTSWGINCTPERTTVNTTRSNIRSGGTTTFIPAYNSDTFTIYPNPATNNVSIKLPFSEENSVVIIYNAIGGIIYYSAIVGQSHSINTEKFAAGIYSVGIQNASGNAFKKLLIQ